MSEISQINSIWTVVVTFNSEDFIAKCLGSTRISSVSTQVVVVDNNSSDKTVDIVKSDFPEVELIELDENIGFGRANNIGIAIAMKNNADFVFLLNQDAWVNENTLVLLKDVLTKNSQFGAVGPIQMQENWTDIEPIFKSYLKPINTPGYNPVGDTVEQVYETKFINAAAWFLSASTVERIGGFDPLFFMYGEDLDLVNRMHFHGLKLGVVPNSRVVHARTNSLLSNQVKRSKKEELHKRVYRFQVRCLCRLKDLKNDLPQEFKKVRKEYIKALINSAIRIKPSPFAEYWKSYFYLVSKKNEIKIHRDKCRKGGPIFLELDK